MFIVFAYNDLDQFGVNMNSVNDLCKARFDSEEDARSWVEFNLLEEKFDKVEIIEF